MGKLEETLCGLSPIGSARMGVNKIHLGVIPNRAFRRPRPSNSNRSNERKIFKRGIRSLIIYGINHRTAQLDFLLSHKYIHQISRTREQRKRRSLCRKWSSTLADLVLANSCSFKDSLKYVLAAFYIHGLLTNFNCLCKINIPP